MTKEDEERFRQIRQIFYNASGPGQYERVTAAINALPEVPENIREDLDILRAIIERGDWQATRDLFKSLWSWYRGEVRRLRANLRTINRLDRLQKAEFMQWAAGINPKTASNVTELAKLPGFNESWALKYEPLTIRKWAKAAGFKFKRGAPKGEPQRRGAQKQAPEKSDKK